MPTVRLSWPPPALPPLAADQVDLYWIGPQWRPDLPRRARSQSLLLGLLAAYLQLPPDLLRLAREAHGRPYLDHPQAPDFNLSDTRGGTVLAVAQRGRVGIDLERLDRRPPAHSLAERWFHADEAAALAGLNPELAATAFLRLWTAKEAACKATGSGIFGWLEQWQFDPAAESPRLHALPAAAGRAADWHFLRWTPAPGFTSVLACQGFVARIRRQFRLESADG